ncbi:MAG: hypothetical protein ACJ0BR_03085 [Candidatus Puniceispirillales bacterium]
MFYIFKILITLLVSINVVNAKEIVSVEGMYSYGPSISQNEACNRAIMNGKNEATRRVSGESISNDTIENCVQEDCKLYEKTWSSLGKNTVITGISNLTKEILEVVGEKTCKVKFEAEVIVLQENKNKDFYITTDYGVKKKVFKASSSLNARDGDALKMKIMISEPSYLYVYAWYPEDNADKLVHVISYPQYGDVKQSYNFPPSGEAFFLISDTKNKNSSSEYLLLIASKQKINLGKDIDFDNMKKLLYDIPTSNWTKERISYTVVK